MLCHGMAVAGSLSAVVTLDCYQIWPCPFFETNIRQAGLSLVQASMLLNLFAAWLILVLAGRAGMVMDSCYGDCAWFHLLQASSMRIAGTAMFHYYHLSKHICLLNRIPGWRQMQYLAVSIY